MRHPKAQISHPGGTLKTEITLGIIKSSPSYMDCGVMRIPGLLFIPIYQICNICDDRNFRMHMVISVALNIFYNILQYLTNVRTRKNLMHVLFILNHSVSYFQAWYDTFQNSAGFDFMSIAFPSLLSILHNAFVLCYKNCMHLKWFVFKTNKFVINRQTISFLQI